MISLCVCNTYKYFSYNSTVNLITEKSFYRILSFIGLTLALKSASRSQQIFLLCCQSFWIFASWAFQEMKGKESDLMVFPIKLDSSFVVQYRLTRFRLLLSKVSSNVKAESPHPSFSMHCGGFSRSLPCLSLVDSKKGNT